MGEHRESITENWARPPLEPPRPPREVLAAIPAPPSHESFHMSALELDAADYDPAIR